MPNIRHELLIGVPPEKVYEAITRQEGLAGWWTPAAKAEAERGSIARFPFGPDYFKEMKVTDLEPSSKVEWTCIKGADEWVGTQISFSLEGGNKDALLRSHPETKDQAQQSTRGSGTLLVFNHDGWRDYTPMFAECNYTWGQFLRSLKLLCETGQGQPWPHQHRVER